jgi:hypothetical protein
MVKKQRFIHSIFIAFVVSMLTVLVWMIFMGSFSVPDPKNDHSVVAGMSESEARQYWMSVPTKEAIGIDAFVLGIQTLGFGDILKHILPLVLNFFERARGMSLDGNWMVPEIWVEKVTLYTRLLTYRFRPIAKSVG